MKLDLFSKNNQLDEMQEQTLRKIESRSFWFCWWLLLAAIVIQGLQGSFWPDMAGELAAFMLSSIYMVAACLKQGIWDRHWKPQTRTNLFGSVLAGIGVFVFNLFRLNYWPGALMSGVCTALLTLAVLEFTVLLYKKRHASLEKEQKEEEDE